jgi:hypothetical protein
LNDSHKLARIAGLLYLLSLPTTGFWYGVGNSLELGNAAALLANVQTHRHTFEIALIAGAIGAVDHLVLAVLLCRLFSPVGRTASALLVAFTAVSVTLCLAALARQMDVLALLDTAAIDAGQLQLHVALAMRSYQSLFLASAIFWGIWLVPLGWLALNSGFVPRTVGWLLWLGAPFYVLAFVGGVFDAGYQESLLGRVAGIASGVPDVIGEGAFALWLLIVGTRRASGRPRQKGGGMRPHEGDRRRVRRPAK